MFLDQEHIKAHYLEKKQYLNLDSVLVLKEIQLKEPLAQGPEDIKFLQK